MAEHTRGQRNMERPDERSEQRTRQQEQQSNVSSDNMSRRDRSSDQLDEKSSTIGRAQRQNSRGLSSKDGLTGSDLDGQVTS